MSLDVVALQEIGDPAMTRNVIDNEYLFVASPGPTPHQAGVALLIKRTIVPMCRAFKRSSSGRLVGVVIEFTKGRRTLIVSAYMPSGLDHASRHDDDVVMARNLYDEVMTWTRDMTQVVLMGDLNETRTSRDRYPQPMRHHTAVYHDTPIQCLPQQHFIDTYRHLHPDHHGFTHYGDTTTRRSRSRIDYIWTRGIPTASLHACGIDTSSTVKDITHHRMVWLHINNITHQAAHDDIPQMQLRLPNLRRASEQQLDAFTTHLEQRAALERHTLESHVLPACTPASLDALAVRLIEMTHDAAFDKLPITGAAARKNKTISTLMQQRRDLTRLLRLTTDMVSLYDDAHLPSRSAQWRHIHARCVNKHRLHWHTLITHADDLHPWIRETQQHIRDTRRMITKHHHRLDQLSVPALDTNPVAMIHRMIDSESAPSHIYSVVDNNGDLTSSPQEMEDVLVQHFESVFALPDDNSMNTLAHQEFNTRPVPDILQDKPGIDSSWYQGLMKDMDEEELLSLVADAPLVSAAGEDGVSVGVWKIVINGCNTIRHYIMEVFNGCLRTSSFPTAWKTSVIVPILKDGNKERTMSNIRPISLQSCLGKLFTKLLARRLSIIFQTHSILHTSQRGFVRGGTTMKCIDELLDAWEWSRKSKQELHTIFYDIKQAYDSVQSYMLARAMRRLRMPDSFIHLVCNSLSQLMSRVRTCYGVSRSFKVMRSLRQGDPLSPILFDIIMDGLHDGLNTNPFTGKYHGCTLTFESTHSIEVPSLGYADDSTIMTNTLEDLKIQNDWVQYFMWYNELRLNPLKCEVVGRMGDGTPLSQAQLIAHGIDVDGHHLIPKSHQDSIRYLGLHVTLDGSFEVQMKKSQRAISMFTRLANKFDLSLAHTVYMFNVFLMPRLELALHYVHGPKSQDWIQSCDRLMMGCIKHRAASPARLSHSALALTLHILLPSWIEAAVKVSELFIRLNSLDSRWGELGRMILRQAGLSMVDCHTPIPSASAPSLISRSVNLAYHQLQWEMRLRTNTRSTHIFDTPPNDNLPPILHRTTAPCITLDRHTDINIVNDHWTGWDIRPPPMIIHTVHVYTDGSQGQLADNSAWSVVIQDDWLQQNYRSVPVDEDRISAPDLGGSSTFGANISCTQGIYPAELQAIARALAMFPLSCHLHLHIDSQAAMKAVNSFEHQLNERRRLRSAARPILQLIVHMITRRRAAGGSVTLSHIRAHTTNTDIHSVGNRIADYRANSARKHDTSTPVGLAQLPVDELEHHLTLRSAAPPHMQIIDDPRRMARDLLKAKAMFRWKSKVDADGGQGLFAGDGAVDCGAAVMRLGSRHHQSTLVHVVTNTIHRIWIDAPDGSSQLGSVECTCHSPLTLSHLTGCRQPQCIRFRMDLRKDILAHIQAFPECAAWCAQYSQKSLRATLLCLFQPGTATTVGVDDHFTACMASLYTDADMTTALRTLCVRDKNEGRKSLQRLRLVIIDHIHTFYASKKA
jgi:exonuclease III/ribonuclease HI